ncbi:Sel1 repeat-containing protein [Pleionea mediterranea]|uniref:Sel1 repeat-containing protein n=2 Tax=Pleionea mediterranea TaxID=523701 RepID=A0A316FSV9_9GAMM|nr:Sel1 repeat-containing protein [Pleionea mediterranea]
MKIIEMLKNSMEDDYFSYNFNGLSVGISTGKASSLSLNYDFCADYLSDITVITSHFKDLGLEDELYALKNDNEKMLAKPYLNRWQWSWFSETYSVQIKLNADDSNINLELREFFDEFRDLNMPINRIADEFRLSQKPFQCEWKILHERCLNEAITECLDSMLMLYSMFINSKGCDRDTSAAMSWLQKAADAGDAFAQYRVGSDYLDGRFVQENIEKAQYYLCKAAEHENNRYSADAERALGRLRQQKNN